MPEADTIQSDAKKIIQAFLDAQNVLAEFNNFRLRAAGSGHNPDAHPRVRSKKVELHTASMMAYMRMRHYIKTKLSESFWRIDLNEIDRDSHRFEPWMLVLRNQQTNEAGLHVLDTLQSPIETHTEIERVRHQGKTERTTYQANLASQEFYETVIYVLGECLVRLGLGADVSADDGDAGFEYADILEEGPPDEPELQNGQEA